jgi:hypothetical protein
MTSSTDAGNPMRLKPIFIPVAVFYLLAIVQLLVAAPSNAPCEFPKELRNEIKIKYPGATITSFSDLSEDNQRIFQKDHGHACPGFVKVDFYGDHKPTWALVLISGAGANEKAELIVAHQMENGWSLASLETAKSSVPVVWAQAPGTYRDVYGEKSIRARRPVIVFGEYSAWIIVYSWTGTDVDKIWLID